MTSAAAQMRVVMPHEMFFSLTDERGVITGANSVFMRIAAYSRAELLGTAHNVVRAPEMPAGVFRLMWDVIEGGNPFAGYVLNTAHDGARYWVFATVTPVEGGYLSVRSAPSVEAIWVKAAGIYERVLRQEIEARAKGATRREAAELGKRLILEELARIGFSSYEDFMRAALPAEASARSERAESTRPAVAAGEDPTYGEIYTIASSIDRETSALLSELSHYSELSDSLSRASDDTAAAAHELAAATVSARAASEMVQQQAPAVLSTAAAMAQGGERTLESLEQLTVKLEADYGLIADLQIRIAISKLHADWVMSFVEELLTGSGAQDDTMYIPEVCHALQVSVERLAHSLVQHTQNMAEVVSNVESLSEALGEFQSFLFMWRNLLIRHGVSRAVGEHLGPIDRQLSSGFAQLVTLRQLAQRFLAESRPYDAGPLLGRVEQLEAAGQRAYSGRL